MKTLTERLIDTLTELAPDHPLLKEAPCRYCGGIGQMFGFLWSQMKYTLIRCEYCGATGCGPNRLAVPSVLDSLEAS